MRVILIGPPGVGKSSVAVILADLLDLPHAPMDMLRFGYYAALGYDVRTEDRIGREGGFPAVVEYWKPFQPHAVECILAHYPNAVVDFGAGDSHFENSAFFQRVEAALADEPNVVLLLPSMDDDETLRVIGERLDRNEQSGSWPVIVSQVRHPSNRMLAKHVLYTGTSTPEEVAKNIIPLLR